MSEAGSIDPLPDPAACQISSSMLRSPSYHATNLSQGADDGRRKVAFGREAPPRVVSAARRLGSEDR